MKEVLCIKKPGFFFTDGERYGPLYNEVCLVTHVQKGFISEGKLWYPEHTYYKLKGYETYVNKTWGRIVGEGFPFFLSHYFVDLLTDAELESMLAQEELSLKEVHRKRWPRIFEKPFNQLYYERSKI